MFTLSNFYKSNEWQKLRNNIMLERMVHGDIICDSCNKPITKKYDCIAHHKIHLTDSNVNDYSISLNPDNIELVHHACHNKIHDRFCSYTRHIYIVYGAPLSGKSYYVDSIAMKDDLIIDLNRLFSAINNSRSNRLYSNVMFLYRELIDMVKTRNGKWVNAFIIRGFPLLGERERLANDLDAELIFIDTDKETCLSRATTQEQIKYIHDWFEKYQN